MLFSRQLDDGNTDSNAYDGYYAEPPDTPKSKGKTIIVLTIFVILIAISVIFFIANLLFPGFREMIEARSDSPDEDAEMDEGNESSYKPPRPHVSEIALV